MSDRLIPELETQDGTFDRWTGTYTTLIPQVRCRIMFDRMQDGENGAIWCEAQGFIDIDGEHKTLTPPTRINLMNGTRGAAGWKGFVQGLEETSEHIQWNEAMSIAVSAAIELYRNGDREIVLTPRGVDKSHPFLLEPFIASSGVSVFFGEGGTGKSLIALAMAVTVASGYPMFGKLPQRQGPVMYFDYEDDSDVHAERLEAIIAGTNIELKHPIYHRSLVAKVAQSQSSMRRSIDDTGSVLAVLDSIGMGRGGNANTAEDTVRLFRALRSLGVPTVAVDHVSKEDKRSGDLITPYGSVYTVNSARLLWGAVVAESNSNHDVKYLNLQNTKANRTHLHAPIGLKVTYANSEDKILGQRWLSQVTFDTHDQWWGHIEVDVWTQVRVFLESNQGAGAWSPTELSMMLGIREEEILSAIEHHRNEVVLEKRGSTNCYALVGAVA